MALISCKKTGTMTVIKDCTGQYLRFNELDYRICNTETVSHINSGTIVDAAFKKSTGKCDDKIAVHCMMLHPYKMGDWIDIIKIK